MSSADYEFFIYRKTINELVEGNCFNIPDFQRDFTWQSQFNTFLEDIENSYKHADEKEYYIGTVITYVNDDTGRQEIVDGQQRLTSVFITLMGYLIYLINENKDQNFQKTAKKILQKGTWGPNSEEDVPVISTSDPDAQDWFDEFYQTSFKTPKESKNENTKWHHSALKTAIDFFKERDNQRGERVNIHELINFILKHVVVAHVDAKNFRQAYVVFERMNDRGKPLSIPDKIKYLLMRRYTISPDEFKKYSGTISEDWRKVADKFQNNEAFTTFLVHYFTAFYSKKNSDFFAKDEIVDWFRENWDDSKNVFNLLDHMDKQSEYYINFQDQLDIRKNASEEPSLAYMYEFFDRSINQHYPILLAATSLTNEKFKKVCENILKITAVNGICDVKWQTIRTGKNSIMEMVLKLRENDLDGFEKIVKNALFDTVHKKQFVQELVKKDKFGDNMGNVKLRKFLTTKVEDIVQNQAGKDFRFTRLEEAPVEHKGKKGKPRSKKTTSQVTLEHILASSISKKDDSKDYDNTQATLQANKPPHMHEQDILNILGRLGNFVASGQDENTKYNKKPVDEKIKGYKSDLFTTRLIAQDWLTINYKQEPGESDQTRTMRKYHYEPIKLEKKGPDGKPYANKRSFFLEAHIAKREHIIINVLKDWMGFKDSEVWKTEHDGNEEEIKISELFTHPQTEIYDCNYCSKKSYNPYAKPKVKKNTRKKTSSKK